MNMMKILKKVPLHSCETNNYTGVIFNTGSYKMLSPKNKEVDIFTLKLNKICSKKTCFPYESISFSKNSDEFLVIKTNDYKNIYVIDNKYNELCTIKLNVPSKYYKKINSISFDIQNYKIFICLDTIVYSVTLDGDFIKEELSKNTLDKIRYRENKEPSYRCCNQYINQHIKLSCASFICDNLVIAYEKNNSAYLSEISKSGNIIETYYVDDEISIDEIFLVKDKVEMLITKQKKYDYIYVTDCSCNNKKRCNNVCETLNPCQCTIKTNCKKSCKNDCCKDDLCDIIESIALIETALSHILNAEGEKIQKAVKIACECDDLIKVNESVSRTITNITMLETVLTDKLSMALDSCEKKCCKSTKKCS